jgi:hypothetical protein
MAKQQEKAVQALMDVKEVFGTPAGKRVLHGLMADAGFFSAGVPSSGEEALALCAKRSLVTALLQTMKMKPEQLSKFYDEQEQYE